MSRKTKLFAWDFHGVLERGTEVGFASILKELANEYEIDKKITLEEVRKKYGVSVKEYLKHFFPEASGALIDEMRAYIATVQNQEHIASFVTAAPNAKEVLNKIRKAGHKNIVITNSAPRHIKVWIKTVGLLDLFDRVYALDKHYKGLDTKPHLAKARAIKEFAKREKINRENIVVIGDRSTDVEAGLLAGGKVYQFARKGFPIDKTGAHYKVYDLRDVLREI